MREHGDEVFNQSRFTDFISGRRRHQGARGFTSGRYSIGNSLARFQSSLTASCWVPIVAETSASMMLATSNSRAP